MQLVFLNYGFTCDQAILDACCDLLVLVPGALSVAPTVDAFYESTNRESLQPAPLLTLLGPLPRARMCKICEEILRSKPTTSQTDLSIAFSNLVAMVAGKVQEVNCVCPAEVKHDWMNGWIYDQDDYRSDLQQQQKRCVICQLWEDIGKTLHSMFWCFFVNASPNTTISFAHKQSRNFITRVVTGERQTLEIDYIVKHVAHLVGSWVDSHTYERGIAWGSDSCTIYPTVIKTLSVPSHQSVTFTLTEGNLVFEGRYHNNLQAVRVGSRPWTRNVLEADDIRPSLDGMHISSPTVTIREAFDSLQVLCSLRSSGHDTKLDLKMVILGYIGMRWTDPCHHPMTDLMDLDKDRFRITSITSPVIEGRFGVVMARWNPRAQFFCCERDYPTILVKDCCLNCAAEGIPIGYPVVFIVV